MPLARRKVLVTGASGFVGRALCATLEARGDEVLAVVRIARPMEILGGNVFEIGEIGPNTDWTIPLAGMEAVVHCAARVHVMHDRAADPMAEYRRVNVDGTLNLARRAAMAGVARFIFISSVKVNGEGTAPGQPYSVDSTPAPTDAYGICKHEAEQGLRRLSREVGMEVVIVRPVLVYGPGVKANFRAMMQWLDTGIPLPFGAIRNKRSLVALDNLIDVIATCLRHPAAANQTFLVSDGEDLSTTDLLHRLGVALGKPPRLIAVAPALMTAVAALLGKRDIAVRLFGSLQVENSKLRDVLGWSSLISVDEGLRRAAQAYLDGKRN
jgi:nucleoside-diphosphate-sugar epimerase